MKLQVYIGHMLGKAKSDKFTSEQPPQLILSPISTLTTGKIPLLKSIKRAGEYLKIHRFYSNVL